MKRTHPGQVLALGMVPAIAFAQQGDGTRVGHAINIFKPQLVDATLEGIASLKTPPGFAVNTFATGLKNARILAVAPDGTVYVSRRDQGDVLMLKDGDGDGRADGQAIPVAHRAGVHGLTTHDGKLYMVTVKEIFAADIHPDGTLGPLTMLTGTLPDAGQHADRSIAFGPDGMAYVSVGSTCNACNDTNPENATLLRMSPDGQSRTIFATGLRNTIGFDWQPQTGELWGLDQGIDDLGDEQQPEELNRIEKGKQYGWPHVYATNGINAQSTPPGMITKQQWKAVATPMVMGIPAHASPMQLVFYPGGSYPQQYTGDGFATLRGSWNRAQPSGYEIVRIAFDNGKPRSIEPFVTGFLSADAQTHFARPVGLAVAGDGSLLMADDANGVIYRIAYSGAKAARNEAKPPAGPMKMQAARGTGVPLALQRKETATKGVLTVTSSTIPSGGSIALPHSEYADGVSPPLSWTAVNGAVSYALILEDPDAKSITPFVHWVAWNIPANMTTLPEGLQEQLRLTDPDGLMQGRNSRGSAGYYGPRPPVGDPPHHYHFQILALDTMLDAPLGGDRDQVLAAARGHVLAKGEMVGTFQQMVKPLK